jgi:ABC-type polysaccharide/polyol phosphate export permease
MVLRYLRIYKKYRFRLVTDILWIFVNLLTFIFMGSVIMPATGTISYSYTSFFMIAILFWTFFEATFVNAVMAVPEEASNGTLGILYTNGISPLKVIVGQMLASTLIFGLIGFFIVFPIVVFTGVIDIFSISYMNLAIMLPVLAVSWAFMLAMAVTFGSLALMVKKMGGTAGVIAQGLKITSGFFFPIVGFPAIIRPIVEKLPITIGLEMSRNIMILNVAENLLDNMFWMCSGTLFFLLLSYVIYSSAERKARRNGTIETY